VSSYASCPPPVSPARYAIEDVAAAAYDRVALLLLGTPVSLNFEAPVEPDPTATMATAFLLD
jgi:hypothetical protein